MKKCLIISLFDSVLSEPTSHESLHLGVNLSLTDGASSSLCRILSRDKSWEVNHIVLAESTHTDSAEAFNKLPQVSNIEAYNQLLAKQMPDLVFMQVSNVKVLMNSTLSGKLAKHTVDKNIQLICFSGATVNACEALSLGALDFIQMPCSLKRLESSLQKVKVFQSGLSSLQQRAERIIVKSVGNMEMIDVSDILWVKGAANYAELHCKDRVVLHRETLASLENKLSLSSFARVHRSALVNWTKVKAITSELGRYSILKMTNDEEVKLSASYKEHLFAHLGV